MSSCLTPQISRETIIDRIKSLVKISCRLFRPVVYYEIFMTQRVVLTVIPQSTQFSKYTGHYTKVLRYRYTDQFTPQFQSVEEYVSLLRQFLHSTVCYYSFNQFLYVDQSRFSIVFFENSRCVHVYIFLSILQLKVMIPGIGTYENRTFLKFHIGQYKDGTSMVFFKSFG